MFFTERGFIELKRINGHTISFFKACAWLLLRNTFRPQSIYNALSTA